FFQAEDGIRDFHVTGVQTCALPIYSPLDGASPGSLLMLNLYQLADKRQVGVGEREFVGEQCTKTLVFGTDIRVGAGLCFGELLLQGTDVFVCLMKNAALLVGVFLCSVVLLFNL